MSDVCAPFRGKKITVIGLGLLGRGVGDVEFLSTCGAEVLVTDKKTAEELSDSMARLKTYPNITFHLGGHDEKDFTNCDIVIKAAGVPLDSPYIAAAKTAGVPVHMSTALFAKHAIEAGAVVIGITGTRGKTTVAHMLHHILLRAGKRTHLGGNIRGASTLAMLQDVQQGDMCVLELDSWQLQGFGELQISPHVAVLTTFMPDHLNYYGGDMSAYFADKAHVFLYQEPDDIFVLGEQATGAIEQYGYKKKIRARTVVAGAKNLPKQWKLKVPGEHNRYNAGLAVAAADALGIDTETMCEALASFEGVEGRLQFVRELNGVKIYNDNNATTPEATIAALKALEEGKKNIILILGGADKGLDMSRLVSEIKKSCKKVVLLSGTGTEALRKEFQGAPVQESLEEAILGAVKIASEGDVLLFSPAFASFGMFKNEYDRNDQYIEIVKRL
ncbi:UDP-N-acetylmuramoyl-L-alanine--D-glutamate ligase [Candidatus Parcubacteria bacterium]|nr:MAG: UDP-N-acetylmuramoyl-L-alanine--D-glutamate ligase [Candidatus Parcubacteria bacterium]